MFEKLADIEGIPHMLSFKLNELAFFSLAMIFQVQA
jgi:hypothetical protein